ncbi:putative hydrolyase [Lachnellula subtilissima]|uniref:Putative hydrolyase n=1 Tax=Lachnellula subtilissima TaxID=602034 RepID=A0A8H8RVR4_9HELO|nr:putative hydrolyase [Lachnellula subtilissima]
MSTAVQNPPAPAHTIPSNPTPSYTSSSLLTGADVREASRNGSYAKSTSGLAKTYIQANLIVLPSRYAPDFRLLCARNPVPCPLIAESESVGKWDAMKSWLTGLEGTDVLAAHDIRQDVPKYMVYKDSKLVKSHCSDIVEEWTEDHVAFLIGCSYSFESALSEAGLPPRHSTSDTIVPIYRTNIPLCPAGVFTGGTYIASMRPYKRSEIAKVRDITRAFSVTHGEPIAWGWDAVERLGIKNIDKPDWGSSPVSTDGSRFGAFHGDEETFRCFGDVVSLRKRLS